MKGEMREGEGGGGKANQRVLLVGLAFDELVGLQSQLQQPHQALQLAALLQQVM